MQPLTKNIIYDGPIAEVGFHDFRLRPDRLSGLELRLVPQPENQSDPKAIAITALNASGQHRMVGYIPRKETHLIHTALRTHPNLRAACLKSVETTVGHHFRIRVDWWITVWWVPTDQPPPLKNKNSQRRLLL